MQQDYYALVDRDGKVKLYEYEQDAQEAYGRGECSDEAKVVLAFVQEPVTSDSVDACVHNWQPTSEWAMPGEEYCPRCGDC
jgi:hypothetical protein